jgi:hypothetical protein
VNVHVNLGQIPRVEADAQGAIARSIQECHSCAQACDRAADAFLLNRPALIQCIRHTLDCAEICMATGAVANRRFGENRAVVKLLLGACAAVCAACAAECAKNGGNAACLDCAMACRKCERACAQAAALL